jgi:saccharopine dehydrogenase-like NADP-dependent oxidoreductase
MKIVVLGAWGTVGRAIVTDLVASSWVTRVVAGGRNHEKGSHLRKIIDSEKLSVQPVDLEHSEQLGPLLADADVVINATSHLYNIAVMEAALATGTHYLDLGGMFHITRQQLELSDRFAAADLTAILCMGCCPGLSNVLAAMMAEKLEHTDEIHIRVGSRRGPDFVGFNLSPKTQLAEFTRRPVIYKNGRHQELEPLSGRGTYRFAEPIGEAEGFFAIHSEVLTLPANIPGVKNVTYWVAFPPETWHRMEALLEWGLDSREPIEVKGCRISPREFMDAFLEGIKPVSGYVEEYKTLQVEVRGRRNEHPAVLCMETVVGSNQKLNLTSSAFWAGVPASVAAQMVGRGEICRKGVLAPELALDGKRLLEELDRRNIRVSAGDLDVRKSNS